MPKYGKIGVVLLAAIAASIAAISIAAATTTTITPAGDGLHLASTNVSFSWGSSSIICETGEATGTIPNPAASSVVLSNPEFHNVGGAECTTTGIEGANFKVISSSDASHLWELSAVSPSSASIRFPSQPYGLEFISGACTIKLFKADAPLGTWSPGTNKAPYAASSTLKVVNGTVTIFNYEEVLANCPAALTKNVKVSRFGNLNATFIVSDYVHPEKAILLK